MYKSLLVSLVALLTVGCKDKDPQVDSGGVAPIAVDEDGDGYTEEEFYAAYETMTDKLRPWTIDFHVEQNDVTVHGAGSHDKTGKQCRADDPNGKLDIAKTAGYWLKDAPSRGIQHICWDGCMFPNEVLENPETWNVILQAMIDVRDASGWQA